MIVLLLAGLAFLFPVATYCLFLAVLNAREHPTMVSGPWDFLGVLFATSGFLLVGGPLLLYQVQTYWRESVAQGTVGGTSTGWWLTWLALWLVYFGVVIGLAVWLLGRRRAYTVIYNIDLPLFDEALNHTIHALDLEATRQGHRIIIHSAEPAMLTAGGTAAAARNVPARELVELQVDPLPSLCNITLRWQAAGSRLRPTIEAELARLFQSAGIAENPAAAWFLTISTCLFGAIFLGLLAIILVQVRQG